MPRDLQALAANRAIKELGKAIGDSGLLNHCPECFQWVSKPSYLTRHAVKMHAAVRECQDAVQFWAQSRLGLSKPCQWCGDNTFTRLGAHLKKSSMADLSEAMQEARAEFDMFGAYMQTPSALLKKEEGNTAPPTTAGQVAAAPPAKWAKGEAKGEKNDEAQTGKGRATEAAPRPPQQATPAPVPGSTSPNQTGNPGQQRGPQQRQQLASWKRPDGYRQWPNRYNTARANGKARLTLRIEDAVGVIQLDSEFIFFLQTEAAGNRWAINRSAVTQQLYATAVQWHKQKEENPESLTIPMRNILLYNLYNALLMKLEALEVDQELMDTAKARGLIEDDVSVFAMGSGDSAPRAGLDAAGGARRYGPDGKDNLNGDIIPFSLVAQN
ncbi:unnamed protein product, partial [Symbiodinium necroappetens]